MKEGAIDDLVNGHTEEGDEQRREQDRAIVTSAKRGSSRSNFKWVPGPNFCTVYTHHAECDSANSADSEKAKGKELEKNG